MELNDVEGSSTDVENEHPSCQALCASIAISTTTATFPTVLSTPAISFVTQTSEIQPTLAIGTQFSLGGSTSSITKPMVSSGTSSSAEKSAKVVSDSDPVVQVTNLSQSTGSLQ